MYVRMNVVYVCMYIRMHIYLHTYICMHIHICMYRSNAKGEVISAQEKNPKWTRDEMEGKGKFFAS